MCNGDCPMLHSLLITNRLDMTKLSRALGVNTHLAKIIPL